MSQFLGKESVSYLFNKTWRPGPQVLGTTPEMYTVLLALQRGAAVWRRLPTVPGWMCSGAMSECFFPHGVAQQVQGQFVLAFKNSHAMWAENYSKVVHRVLVPVTATP